MNWLISKKKKNKKKQALLIFPWEFSIPSSTDTMFPFPLLGLSQIAATFPSDYNVRIVDERLTSVSGNEEADIVFLTTLTSTVTRAYILADLFTQRAIPVVIGGIHATLLPKEALQHATSVVIGEVEEVIDQLLSDFKQGGLLPKYRSSFHPKLENIPKPAFNLLSWRHRFILSSIQTSRGCPNNCKFCSVPPIFGGRLRLKSLSVVESELKYLSQWRSRYLYVVDDNFTAVKDRTLAIVDLFKYYGYRWMCFANLSVSEDEEFLLKLRESGCLSLFIGFESLHGARLSSKNRSYNSLDTMRQAINRIHKYQIGIQGSFIFGFDEDTADVFKETVSFIQSSKIELPTICVLTPFPGTPLFDSLEQEGRIIHKEWSLYDMNHVVFKPLNISPEVLQQGYAWTLKYLAAPSSIQSRLNKSSSSKLYFLMANYSLHRSQTRLAHFLWDATIQSAMQRRGICPC